MMNTITFTDKETADLLTALALLGLFLVKKLDEDEENEDILDFLQRFNHLCHLILNHIPEGKVLL